MHKTLKIIKLKSVLIFILVFSFGVTLSNCSKDDNLLSQEELVKISNDYKNTLKDIVTCEKLITQLTEKLKTADEKDKPIIRAQLDNEEDKLEQLQKRRIELENKLGIKKLKIDKINYQMP